MSPLAAHPIAFAFSTNQLMKSIDGGTASRMPESDRDEPLIEALAAMAAEDQAGFERLHAATYVKLRVVCADICGSREAGDDALQETYLALWSHAASYDRRKARPMAWILTIARNKAKDRYRREARVRHDSADDFHHIADPAELALEELLARELDSEVRARFAELEEPDRQALLGAFFESETYIEQSRRTGIAVPTLKSRVRRALIRLKQALEVT